MRSDLASFVREHCPAYRKWGERLDAWLEWFDADTRLARALHGERLVGIGLMRQVRMREPEELIALDRYEHDEKNPVVYVDLVAGTDPRAMSALWECMLKRSKGAARWLAFRRHKHGGRITVWPLNRATRFFLKHLGAVKITTTHTPSLLEA